MYRYDPEKSTRIKWETTYTTELTSHGLTQDFTGLSTLLLGQAQTTQFQTGDQVDSANWRWGSAVVHGGTFALRDSPTTVQLNNIYSVMPRSYVGWWSQGGLYNFHVASAESGSSLSSGTAPDSICPSGWEIPTESGSKSWSAFLSSHNITTLTQIGNSPHNLILGGYIQLTGTYASLGNGMLYWTSVIRSQRYAGRIYAYSSTNDVRSDSEYAG